MTATQQNPFPILRYFACAHLPPALRTISEPFGKLADSMVATGLPENAAETAAGLRKLLEAKDCAVRAALKIQVQQQQQENRT